MWFQHQSSIHLADFNQLKQIEVSPVQIEGDVEMQASYFKLNKKNYIQNRSYR